MAYSRKLGITAARQIFSVAHYGAVADLHEVAGSLAGLV